MKVIRKGFLVLIIICLAGSLNHNTTYFPKFEHISINSDSSIKTTTTYLETRSNNTQYWDDILAEAKINANDYTDIDNDLIPDKYDREPNVSTSIFDADENLRKLSIAGVLDIDFPIPQDKAMIKNIQQALNKKVNSILSASNLIVPNNPESVLKCFSDSRDLINYMNTYTFESDTDIALSSLYNDNIQRKFIEKYHLIIKTLSINYHAIQQLIATKYPSYQTKLIAYGRTLNLMTQNINLTMTLDINTQPDIMHKYLVKITKDMLYYALYLKDDFVLLESLENIVKTSS